MNYHSFFFHLLLQDTCIFEVCFMVSVAFFSEVNVRLFLDKQNLLKTVTVLYVACVHC